MGAGAGARVEMDEEDGRDADGGEIAVGGFGGVGGGCASRELLFFRTNDDQEHANEIADMGLHQVDPYLSAMVMSNGER